MISIILRNILIQIYSELLKGQKHDTSNACAAAEWDREESFVYMEVTMI